MRTRLALGFTASLLALGASVPANAQPAPPPTEEAEEDVDDEEDAAEAQPVTAGQPAAQSQENVVVTGTRLRGTFSSPTPVTSTSQQELLAAAPANIADGLRQVPSVVVGGGQTAGGGTRSGGQNFLNLRGLGNTRTLILLDGRRFVPADPRLIVDINLIPQGLVERVDIVTGGASATYGSDAVAGVVNFILNRRFTGLNVDTVVGISQRGDNQEFRVTGTAGAALLDGRVHVIAGAEYFDGDGVSGSQRDFRVTAGNQIPNPANTAFLVRADDVRTPFTGGGLVVNGTGGTAANNALIRGIQFAPGGAPIPYDYGTLSTTIGSSSGFQNGGDGFRVSTGQEVVRPLERRSAFAHVDIEASDALTFFVEGVYGWSMSEFHSSPTTRTSTIQRGNAFLAQAAPGLVAQMTALGVTGFTFNRLTLERGPTVTLNENETIRGITGAELELGNWQIDASVQYGRNDNHSPTVNNLILANYTRALNAVRAPTGEIVCADLLSTNAATRAAAAGCVPFNPFGFNSPSSAALDYVMGTSVFDTRTEQYAAEANVAGTLFDLPAGPVAVALGLEWRDVRTNTVADPTSIAGGYRLINQQNFSGRYDVREVFGELQVPILRDSPVGRSLEANLAARYTDYSTSGGVTTWKVGLVWQLISDLRLRGTWSRDIRAPHLEELFATGRQNNITINDALTGRQFLSVPNRTFGNPDLDPERATTKVVGFVYQPSWLPGFNLAADYYSIRINGAIENVGGQNAVDQCNLSNQQSPLCAFVERDATNAVIGTRTSPFNFTSQETDGVDFEMTYRVPVDTLLGVDGRLTLRALGTYVAHNRSLSPLILNPVDDVGNLRTSSQPHWRGNLTANYDSDRMGLFLQARYIGGMTWDKTRTLGVNTDFNSISPQLYLDGRIAVKLDWGGERQELFLQVQNLLDHQPPYSPSPTGATPLPIDPNLYDQVGRMFRVGWRARF